MASYDYVYDRVHNDNTLAHRVAAALTKFAAYEINNQNATEEQRAWAAFVLADIETADKKATNMMWRVCWDVGVVDTPTETLTDAAISAVVEPIAFLY